jgi:hypothetical protein
MSNIPDDIKSEPEDVNADQHLGDGMDAADPAAADKLAEGTFDNDGERAGGQEPEGLATGDGPTESGGKPQKKQGDPMDDVDLKPPSS